MASLAGGRSGRGRVRAFQGDHPPRYQAGKHHGRCGGKPAAHGFRPGETGRADPIVTMKEQVLGTPGLHESQQARGNSQAVDRRTDVYSLGASSTICSRSRSRSTANPAGHDKVLPEPPIRPRMIDKQIPIDLETIASRRWKETPNVTRRREIWPTTWNGGCGASRSSPGTLARSSIVAVVPPQSGAGRHDRERGPAPPRRQHRIDDHRIAGGERTQTRSGRTAASGDRQKGGSGCPPGGGCGTRQEPGFVVARIRRKGQPLSPRPYVFG